MNSILTGRAPRWVSITISVCALGAIFAFVLPVVVIRRDRAFVCEYTGSQKGYRQWLFGLKTHRWYRPSPVETTIQRNYPNQLDHHWTSYAGTGYNVLGSPMLYGHGRPGAIFELRGGILEYYTAKLEPQEIKALYDLLRFGSNDVKRAEIKRIQELWLNQ